MADDFVGAGFAKDVREDLATSLRDLFDIGIIAVALLEIRFLEAIERLSRIGLCVTGETPCANRRSDQVNRRGQLRQQPVDQDTVYLAQDQPLRTAGRAGDGADSARIETVLAELPHRTGSGKEIHRIRHNCRALERPSKRRI